MRSGLQERDQSGGQGRGARRREARNGRVGDEHKGGEERRWRNEKGRE